MSADMMDFLRKVPKLAAKRSKDILQVNPTIHDIRPDNQNVRIKVYDYNAEGIHDYTFGDVHQCFQFKNNGYTSWINVDGIRKAEIEQLSQEFGIHQLLVEDILSSGQRPKMDEVEGILFCQLNMLYYNDEFNQIESEQVSIVLGRDFVISIQEDDRGDVFDGLRNKLQFAQSKVRQRNADYLLYSMLDVIVDNYFLAMEKIAIQIENLEEQVSKSSDERCLAYFNHLRKELIVLRRNIIPVRDLITGIIRSESELLEERNTKYFKDINDHITQAFDLTENYRDMLVGIQELYINNVNLKLNEIMKFIAIVTCLMAPATVIGGIFGMNFDVIPYTHHKFGFYAAVGLMLIIPLFMLFGFKKRGWF